MKYISPLSDSSIKFSQAGGKGINLVKLAKHFNVPDGFIITTEAYLNFIKTYNLQNFIQQQLMQLDNTFANLEAVSQQIRTEFHKYSLPESVAKNVITYFNTLEKGAYAVRSSATAEDLPNLSFAGQHDTFLNIVTEEDLLTSIVQCFSSVWTARAIQYRKLNKINQLDVTIAVVIQKMVESEISGVMFTANPITGNRTETVIEAIIGLGEALVSGLVEPDTYIVNSSNEIVNKKIGNQQKAIFSINSGGTVEKEITNSNQILSDQQIITLRKIGKQIFDIYNTPQDIEWAIQDQKIYILQSRGITTLYPLPDNMNQNGIRIFASFNIMQGVMDPFTPIGLDGLQRFGYGVGETFHFADDFEHQQTLLAATNRMWTDVTAMYLNPLGRKALIGFMEIADPESQKILYQLAEEERFFIQNKRPNMKTLQILFRDLMYFGKKIRKLLQHPDLERKAAYEKSMQFLAIHKRKLEIATSMTVKLDLLEKNLEDTSHFLFTTLAPFISTGMMTLALINKISKAEKLGVNTLDLTRSTPHNPTTIMNLNMWKRAVQIRKDSTAKATFEKMSVEELTKLYKKQQLPLVAQIQISEFLQEYGFRGYAEIDVGKPRWNDTPEVIISHIQSYVKLNDPEHYPDTMFIKGRKGVQTTYHTLFQNTLKDKFGNIKGHILNFMIERNRKLFGYREFPKFIWIKALAINRVTLIEIGSDLVAQNALESLDDIFFLHMNDLKEYTKNPAIDLRKRVITNKISYEEELTRNRHPRIILSTGETYYHPKVEVELKEGNILGSPVSSGIVEGKARVMLLPNEGTLQPKEILVCPATDPSWTPLFQVAAGLVMEIGGMMTHGGVVAREHGIPAVVSVADATKIIKTGQLLRVNGNTGLIEIID